MADMVSPACFSSASKEARPVAMFSSRRSFLNHWRILLRASLDLQIFIQSRLGPLGGLGGDNLHNVPGLELGVEGDDAPVDQGAGHVVAHLRVDGVGEVDGGGPGGQALHVPLGGKDEHLVGEHIHLQGSHKFLRIGVLLALQQLADPLDRWPRCPASHWPCPACTSSGRQRRTRRSGACPRCGSAPRRGCPRCRSPWCAGTGSRWAWECRYSP